MLEIIGKTDSDFMGKRLREPYMNLLVGTIASLFVLILIQGGTGNADTPPFQQDAKGDVITQEEALIAQHSTILRTLSHNFQKRKTPHPFSVSTRKIMQESKTGNQKRSRTKKQYLAEVLDQINLGEPIGISSKVMNIKPSVAGRSRMGNV